MKRIFFVFTLLAVSLFAGAQVKHQLGFQIGSEGNLFRLNSVTDTAVSLAYNLNGPSVGLAYEVDFFKGLGLYLAANYSYSLQIKNVEPSMYNNYEVRTLTDYHALTIPLHLQYRFLLAQDTWITFYAGPTFQFGLKMQQTQTTAAPISGLVADGTKGGNYLYNYDFYRISELASQNKYADADNDNRRDRNRFNPLLGIGLAFQFHQFYVRGGYNWGLANMFYDRTYTDLTNTSYEWVRRQRQDEWSVHIGWYIAYTK